MTATIVAARPAPTTTLPDERVHESVDTTLGNGADIVPLAREPDAALHVRALAPDITVTTADDRHTLGGVHGKVVGFLLAANRPVTTDEVIDTVWPDTEFIKARNRLYTALHRLRGNGLGALVQRDRHGLHLGGPEHGVWTDVQAFLDADPHDAAQATSAARLYGAGFASRQLAYEEFAHETRRWLEARYITLCVTALRSHVRRQDAPAVLDLAMRARPLAAGDRDLAFAIMAVLERCGRAAESRALAAGIGELGTIDLRVVGE